MREAIVVSLERRALSGGASWFAQIDDEEFLVGADVRYQSRRGLMMRAPQGYLKYDADGWRTTLGVWADMIAITSEVEGQGDLCTVNSYDRAAFTFGLMQWGAHTPNDNFVLLLRRLLALPSASAYFPDLCCGADGRVARRLDNGLEPLESASSTVALQRYLNPDETKVDEAEATAAAKLIHWVKHDGEARDALIRFAVEHYRNRVADIHQHVGLDGKTDVEVLVCADIHHQGRGNYNQMRAALAEERSVEALLAIGAQPYPERIEGLRRKILTSIAAGKLGRRRYDATHGEMVESIEERLPPQPWPEAHLIGRAIGRTDTAGVRRLSEAGAPRRTSQTSASDRAEALRAIALWLDPKVSPRYQRQRGEDGGPGATRCNIYAYDFATLAGAYLPRVWWNDEAIAAIESGRTLEARYNRNVVEVSANNLLRWFKLYAARYGWRRLTSGQELQAHANAGGLGIIVARNRHDGSSGHITVVAPENSVDENGVCWNGESQGGVFIPVQSQAGAVNFSFGTTREWWKYDYMAEFGFWAHD